MSDLKKMTIEELVKEIQTAEKVKAEADRYVKSLKAEFQDRRQSEITDLYKEKDEPFGTVHLCIADKDIEITTRKEVEWDQEALAAAHHKMLTDGLKQEEIMEYLKITYGISETAWKNWPRNIKAYFEGARTVTPGSVSIKVKDAKE